MNTVVFDIGGVLIDWNPRHLYRRLIPDADQLEHFLAEICTMEWNLTLDAGRSFDDACDALARQHPDHAELIHAWRRQDEMVAGEIPGTAALVGRLRDRGVPLYLLTNMPSAVYRSRVEHFPVLREFAGAVVSGDEGVLKPSAAIFERLIARFGCDPATTLFIDDTERNVIGARALGFEAHHFIRAEELEVALAGYGLLPS